MKDPCMATSAGLLSMGLWLVGTNPAMMTQYRLTMRC